ncbi:hypothetical protein NDA01_26405 [Trichocoleus desertorum AS-A10]|uniref:hypothetical protein n=1 Tax=Trichocoleus desertorum TaxID=1481672 RepID=UPI003299A5BD
MIPDFDMEQDREEIYKKALPWDGKSAVDFYLKSHPCFPYREQFAKLFSEAYRAYLAGCPRASIITAGEALLRAIYDEIISLVACGYNITIPKSKGRSVSIKADAPRDTLFQLADECSFNEAIKALQHLNIYSQELINRIFVVKELRNKATHGEFPVLDIWDPDEPRPRDEFLKIFLNPEFEFPEGYRFRSRSNSSDWFTFDPRKYKCGSLKPLDWESRFAAIQYLLVLEVITEMRDTSTRHQADLESERL